ncbi:MAG TPA: CopD family protein [Pseudonocardiaceae bacterium]|jgi:putative copper export protein|nr:CopD family protein [Pseudonocardiaceae bacterium]
MTGSLIAADLMAALPSPLDSTAKTAYVAARVIDYLGTALFLGGGVFVAWLWPAGGQVRAARRLLILGWSAGLVGTVAAIGLEGAWTNQSSPGTAWHWSLIEQTLKLDFGREWSAKALLWVLAGVVLADLLRRGERAAVSLPWRVGFAAIGLGILRVTGLTGHAADAHYPALSEVADLVHLAGMSLWIGGLAVLLFAVLPRRQPAELAALLPRFSKLAMGSVLTVIVAGTVLAWQLVGGFGALVDTTYGELLLTKIALLVVILVAAQGSKAWITHRLDFAVVLRGDAATVRPFVLSVAVETALVLLVLIAASFLVTAYPGA